MKRILFFITAVIVLYSCSGDDNSSPSANEITVEEQLQTIIDEKVGTDADKLVGVSVSIRINGQEMWNLQGGLSRLDEPVTNNMRFGVASITKTVVAASIMKLVDENVLSLEDTVGDWLTLNSPNIDDSITILQLLNHFAGLDGYMYSELWEQVEANLEVPIPQIDLVDFIGAPYHEPGETHTYSNSNYLVLGLIIEAATDKTVGEVMREKFWVPLNLNNMYFGTNEAILGPLAAPWRDSDGDGILEDITDQYDSAYHSVFYCAADVFSTASDLSMWANHLYNGNAISMQSRQLMMTSYFDIPHPIFTGYGLGTRRNVYAGHTMWGHTGGMRGYGSAMFYDPISKVSIAMLNNQSRSEDGPLLRHELVEELLEVVFNSL